MRTVSRPQESLFTPESLRPSRGDWASDSLYRKVLTQRGLSRHVQSNGHTPPGFSPHLSENTQHLCGGEPSSPVASGSGRGLMDAKAEEIALFRYGLIAPLVGGRRQLADVLDIAPPTRQRGGAQRTMLGAVIDVDQAARRSFSSSRARVCGRSRLVRNCWRAERLPLPLLASPIGWCAATASSYSGPFLRSSAASGRRNCRGAL